MGTVCLLIVAGACGSTAEERTPVPRVVPGARVETARPEPEPVAPTSPLPEPTPARAPPILRGPLLMQGPASESSEEAAMAGIEGGEGAIVEASVEHGRDTFLLVRVSERAPQGDDPERWSIYLVRVRGQAERFRRESGVLLYDFAVADIDNACEQAELGVASDLRARDLDGDGEVEVTVIVAAAALHVRGRSYDPTQQCGVVAFLVGTSDLDVQARFTREHHIEQMDAGGELVSDLQTTWRLVDIDEDGHADLRVTESYRHRFDFMGDDIGGGEVAPAERERRSNRRSVDCLYEVASDRWACPLTTPPVGQSLFRDRATLVAGERPPLPAW
jgi:hypothetical protein